MWQYSCLESVFGEDALSRLAEFQGKRVVDPYLTGEMPRQLTADSGMDVISHAIEAFTGAWRNDFSDGLSIQALRLAFRYLPRAWKDGAHEQAREHMHYRQRSAKWVWTRPTLKRRCLSWRPEPLKITKC